MDVCAVGIGGQMLGAEMRVPPHHRRRLPAAEFLKDMKRRSVLHLLVGHSDSMVGVSESVEMVAPAIYRQAS